MAPEDPRLGALVEIPTGRGVVRFCGATSFSGGKWVGIELTEPKGKNNGSVNGVTYFYCEPSYGVFVRPSQVKVLGYESDRPDSKPSPPRNTPPSGHQRTLSTSSRRPTHSPIPPPSPRSVSPAKHSSSPSPLRSPRSGLVSPTKKAPSNTLQPSRKTLLIRRESALSAEPPAPSPVATSSPLASLVTTLPVAEPPASGLPESEKPPQPDKAQQDAQEAQELRAKIRVLEAKRADDARHVRELETRLSEAESFVALRPKLQGKLASQQTELISLRRELADLQQSAESSESKFTDMQEQLEMAMLDKEVAEEKAELAEAELEDVKERLAIAEVELEVLKEGGETDEGEQEKTSLAYIQLEKHNERLKDALFRLRDMTQENDQEQRRRISEMEKDVTEVEELKSQHSSALAKLSNAEAQIEDLKLQLDDALGAEEMLVQLTERNLMLGEKIEEMRITIEDLEALKELSDELEENHAETEKALLQDIDSKDVQIREHIRRAEKLEETCQDLEGTILQFRELVYQLQSDLDALRSQTQTAQIESADAASKTAAMMSLNLKLQSSASKSQARNIEYELKSAEAKELRELQSIIQPLLPQLYMESDNDATSCYLFFQRLASKADIINMVVGHTHGLPDSLNGPVSEVHVGVCEMRGRISALSTLCKRFAAIMRKCDPDAFLNIGRLYPELAPMEKRIDMHINLLCKDEFREMECVSDVAKIHAQFDHIAETYFSAFDFDLGERELGHILSFDNDLDVFAASIGLTKTSVQGIIADEDVTLDVGDMDIQAVLIEPLQSLLDLCKGAKSVSKKLTKRLEELVQESSAVKSDILPQMKALGNPIAELVNFGISLAQSTMPHISDARTSKTPFKLATVLSLVDQTASSTIAKGVMRGVSVWEAAKQWIVQLVQDSSNLLPLIMEPENVFKVSGTAPWTTRTTQIKASTAINLEAERKITQLNEEMKGLVRNLREKDQNIQETGVKIELMERRMEAAKKQSDAIADLESKLAKARKQERAYEEAMEQLQADLDTLEQDNAKLKALSAGHERQVSGAQPVEMETIPVEGSMETSYLVEQIEALRGTVRYLRTENSFLKGQDLFREMKALPPLQLPRERSSTPPLVPSGLSDSDDSDSESNSEASPHTLLSLSAETRLLYRDVVKFASSPRVVDLSALNAKRAEAGSGKFWMRRKYTPAQQILERKLEGERLSKRVKGLLERTSTIGVRAF